MEISNSAEVTVATYRKYAPTKIVEHVMDEAAILQEKVRLVSFIFQNHLSCIKWLVARRLLRNEYLCPECNIHMSFYARKTSSDGYTWKCKYCTKCITIRKDSFLSKSNLKLTEILIVIYGWCMNYQHALIVREAGISTSATGTVHDWYKFCRNVCAEDNRRNTTAIGGFDSDGSPIVVEVDEIQLFNKKYYKGTKRQKQWLFGGVERGTGRCFLVEIPDRESTTLEKYIQLYIRSGTIIISDGWSGYDNLSSLAGGIYQHRSLNQKDKCVDSADIRVHTQTIRNLWMRFKKKLRMQCGTSPALFGTYLHDFMWRSRHTNNDTFSEFLICISQQYNVIS